MKAIQTVYDESQKRRVIIYERDDGTFGFAEEHFSDDPFERCWISFGRYSACRCDTAAKALSEARGRISWLEQVTT